MSINISSNFLLGAGLPLDARAVVASTVARDAIPAVQRFEGLTVFVTATNITWQLQDGITNGDWVNINSGGSGFPIADDVGAQWGSTFPNFIEAQVTGQSTPNFALAVDDTHPLFLINGSNIGYDFLGIDATAFFPAPMQFFTGSAQVHNNMLAMGFELGGGDPEGFQISGLGGDDLDSTPRNANGVYINISASDGGSLGGTPGRLSFQAGTAQFGNMDGASLELVSGEQSGSGDRGSIQILSNGSGTKANSLNFEGAQAPGLSSPGFGRIYFNAIDGIFYVSEDGAAYVPMVGGSGTDLVSATLATASGATAATTDNSAGVSFDIPITGVDASTHTWAWQINEQNFFVFQADGNGVGGATNGKALFGSSSTYVDFIFESGAAPIATDAKGFSFAGGAAGNSNPGTSAGHGSDIIFDLSNGGNGGDPTRVGGRGGRYVLITGDGGDASINAIGASGGDILLTTGNGGDGSGAFNGQDGGSYLLTLGSPGADGGAGAGNYGNYTIKQGAIGRFQIDSLGAAFFMAPTSNVAAFNLTDDTGNEYIILDTTPASELMTFGNIFTNPDYAFVGTGTFTGPNGPALFPDALTVSQTFTANGPVDINNLTTIDYTSTEVAGVDVIAESTSLLIAPAADSSAIFYGSQARATTSAALNVNLTTMIGFAGASIVELNAGKTVGAAIGVANIVQVNGGTATTAFGSYIPTMTVSGGGAITDGYGVYVRTQTAATNNHGIVIEPSAVALWAQGGLSVFNDEVDFSQSNFSGGNHLIFEITSGVLTNQTASTELNDVLWNFSNNTAQFATGDVTTQRTVVIRPRTYASVGGTTISKAATFAIEGAPGAGTNLGIDESLAFWIQSGSSTFDDAVNINHTNASGVALNVTASFTPTANSTNYAAAFSYDVGNPAANNGSSFIGFNSNVGNSDTFTHNMTGTFYGMQNSVAMDIGTGNTLTKAIGNDIVAQNVGAGTITTVVGVESIVSNSTGTVTDGINLHIRSGTNSGGTYTNQYGIKIDNLSAATNDYGIYIAGADTYAIWVDAGATRLDGTILSNGGAQTICDASGNLASANGANFGPGLATSITVVNGIVTAIS